MAVIDTGVDVYHEEYYPVDYNHIISVIALNKDNERAYYSNYGKNKDISAPGDSDFTCKERISMELLK